MNSHSGSIRTVVFRSSLVRSVTALGCVLLTASAILGQATAPKPKRARLPEWKEFPSDVFFKDAFRDGLVGPRPAAWRGATKSGNATKQPGQQEPGTGNGLAWHEYVSAATLEDEVKALQIAMQQSVTTPARFSGGGYRDVRRQCTELATVFAVIGSYDREIRWKKYAPHARDLFARTAANAKVTSIQAYNEAKQRKLDLEELVRGGTLTVAKPASRRNEWGKICDRAPLMQRFTACYDEGLEVWTSNANSFHANLANIKREAELLRLFSVVLSREGMEDAADEDYVAYCRELGKAAGAVLRAVQDEDPASARQSVSDVGKSCVQCHEDYRA